MTQYNLRNPAVKRLMREAEELKHPTEEYYAHPLEDNLFEWHFTLRGPPNTEFEGGIYHGRITLPPEYPMKPPSIILLTPNGRFEINKKICLSISGHHPETWQPSWSIRTALLAIIGFLPTHGNGALGSLDYTPEERKDLALKSQNWKCQDCGPIKCSLKNPNSETSSNELNEPDDDQVTEPESSETVLSPSSNDLQDITNDNVNPITEEVVEPTTLDSDPGNIFVSNDVQVKNEEDTSLNVRQRHVVSPPSSSPSESSQTQREASNYWSLVVIWVICALLAFLIARRWLCY